MARTRQLVAPKGTGALLSCALSPHDGGASLAVGGENAAALVFDLRGAHLVAHRLTAASGCFDREDAVPCVSYNLAAPHALYCASGRAVTAWDLRRLPGATDARGATKRAPPTHECVPDESSDESLNPKNARSSSSEERGRAENDRGAIEIYAHNAEEINHFAIDKKGAFLYAADDNCEVAVVDVSQSVAGGKKTKTLRFEGHESFVSCVALRGHKPREVVSGGLDARVCVWDRDRAAAVKRWSVGELIDTFDTRLKESLAEADEQKSEEKNPSRMMNPPFVHCVATWACERDPAHADVRRLAAAACGDGTVALVDLDANSAKKPKSGSSGKKKKASSKLLARGDGRNGATGVFHDSVPAVFLGRGSGGGAHKSATSHVSFPGWGDGEVVVSGGNDREIKLWRWREFDFFSDERQNAGSLKHGKKVNWISHAATNDASPGGGHVFVADTSETIGVYDLNAFA